MTQKQRIFDRMMPADRKMPGPWVHMAELNRITFAYSQRIGDWKKEGYLHEIRIDADGARWYRFITCPPENIGMTSSCRDKAPVVVATRPSEPKKRRGKYHKTQIAMEGIV
jgi:hypothetical protein